MVGSLKPIFKKVSKNYQNPTKNVDLRRLMTKYDSYAVFLTLMSKYAHFVAHHVVSALVVIRCSENIFMKQIQFSWHQECFRPLMG